MVGSCPGEPTGVLRPLSPIPVEREVGRGNISVEEWDIQTIGYKIGSGVYCTTQGI